jgi:hypothetical protein
MAKMSRFAKSKRVFSRIKKVAPTVSKNIDSAFDVIDKGVRFRESIASQPLDYVAKETMSMAKKMKSPIGALGLSLMPGAAKEAAISGSAAGDVTTSATMYAFRPPRKRNREGEITYVKKATTTYEQTSTANAQVVFDINILDAEPVLNNSATAPYSRLTIRDCFDEYLKAQVQDTSQTYELYKQQTSIHVKSVSSELVIKNNNSNIALVEIYELVPQHTLGPSTYGSQVTASGYMSPQWTFNNGLKDVLELEDNLMFTSIDAKPTDSSLWYRSWRVIKKVRVNLTGNSLHRHKSSIAVNKTVTYPESAQFSTSGGKFAGWNPVYMIIQKGAPSGSDTASTTDLTYTCSMDMRYHASAQEQARVIVYDNAT